MSEYISFRDLFKASIHNSGSLSDSQCLSYLRLCLVADPLKIIQSLAVCDNNYEIAWNLLEERYSNRREQIFAHIKRCLNIPVIQTETSAAILHLVDAANESMRCLEILDQKIVRFSDTIYIQGA